MTADTAVATTPVIDETELLAPAEDEAVLLEELLVEEISIDGMCGVY
jgi:mycofactocin precursor